MSKKEDFNKRIRRFNYLFEYKVNHTPSFNTVEQQYQDDMVPTIEEAEGNESQPAGEENKTENQPTPSKPVDKKEVPPVPTPKPITPVAPPTPPVAPSADNNQMEGVLMDKMEKFVQSLDPISQKLADLESRLSKIDTDLNDKLQEIGKDVEDIKQPSAEELYRLSSLNSPPFNIRVDKYWNEKFGKDVVSVGNQQNEKPTTYSIDLNNVAPMSDAEFKDSMTDI
jgi:hypothetical protein